ncbi:adenylate/guanylate cyclase domain-containing protein [Plantactinospora sp. KBS50]|uniref:adenylate/guanylate cyclase domain-containing protein n=1 Tax=Plantactinospora sp. KBS50 TaxID=2024580 RepID=UPI000BAB1CD7|nr:adenylate/guanylate cyclase domain-containing protein [Plantactinospora sp. KBS50]ASW56067.1 guanylate cyclase [Plantactinospora sp. KBS50]
MTCPNCSRVAGPDDRFCAGCGRSLAPQCVHCGHQSAFDARFCTSCGQPLNEPAPTAQEDRRQVSVLFIDIADFTAYAERADPEQARTLQQNYFSAVRRLVRQYGGVVEKYIGDAVMAMFGAPVATDNDALRCVRAGLELQRVLARQPAANHPPMGFRVGVATGEALVNHAAARDGGQAFVTGDVVNTASRLQSLAPIGGVVVDEATYAATQREMEYVEQRSVTLRGRSAVSQVWLASRARPRDDLYTAELAPMVDRDHERGLLVNALHRTVHEGVPQLVTVFGPAGVGKSRLLRELARHAASLPGRRVGWWVGHCPPFGENVAYAALADIVKSWAGILDSDDEATRSERLRARLARLPDGHRGSLPDALAPLVGVRGERLGPGETESAWRRFLLTLTSAGPTVLVFEDMHWADQPMLHFIEQLGAAARGLPLLIIATARPELRERQPAWTSAISGAISISVPPMHDSDIATLYSLLLGQAALPADVLEPLIEFADGNPLYAQEYTRMLVDGGMVRPSGLVPSGTDVPRMPRTVQAVIANRLDLLDAADRAVLQAAAVVGTHFWPGAVAAAVGRGTEWVERCLDRLQQRDLVYEQAASAMGDQPEYRFRHVLVRDICYQRLPRSERVARHQRTADWLEQVSDGQQNDLTEVLANHRWAAHEIARTVGLDPTPYARPARQALLRAARRAYALHALEAAETLINRALRLDLPADLGLDLFAAEVALYRDSDAFLNDNGAERLAELTDRLATAGDRDGAALAWTLRGTAAWRRADRAETLVCLHRAIGLYEDLPASEGKATALLELARVHMINAETEPACVAAQSAVDLASRLELSEVEANARITLAAARYMSGVPAAVDELREVTEHCRSLGLTSRRRAVGNLAWALQEEGDLGGSALLVKEQASIDIGGGHSLAVSFAERFTDAYYAGDWTSAVQAADEATDRPTAEWDLHIVAVAGWMRALRDEPPRAGATRDGFDPDLVEDEVEQALAAARRSGFHRVICSTLAQAALCRAVQGRTEQAVDLLTELDADYRQTTMIAFMEWITAAGHTAAVAGGKAADLVLRMLDRTPRETPWARAARRCAEGTLAAAAGDRAGAAEAYAAAAALYAGMPDRTDQVLATAFLVGVGGGPAEVAAVREFAARNQAGGLLRLAGLDRP